MFGLEPTPDAVGYVLSCGDVSVYHSGDTEYDSEIIADTRGVGTSLVCINGTTGNMNVHEAALLAWLQGARLAVPFHYGLWRDADYGEGATLDPGSSRTPTAGSIPVAGCTSSSPPRGSWWARTGWPSSGPMTRESPRPADPQRPVPVRPRRGEPAARRRRGAGRTARR